MKRDLPIAACMAAGLLLRLAGLGQQPLSTAEGASAWAAWAAVAGGEAALPTQSALLYALQSSVFWLAGSTDALARLPVSLASMVPLVLVWRLAPVFGTAAGTTLAVLLAFDPVSVGYARLADSSALTAAATWAVIICAAGASAPALPPSTRARWAHGVWMAAGVFLVSGPLAWDLLIPLSLLLVVLHGSGMASCPRPALTLALWGVVAGTAALTRAEGLQFVSSGATSWLGTWVSGTTLSGELWSQLARLELLPLVLGVVGLALGLLSTRATSSSEDSPMFRSRAFIALALWTLWALPVALRPGRSLAFWLVAQPPLFLGACYLVSRLAAGAAVPNRRRWIPVATAGAGALAVVYLAGTAGRVATGDRETPFRPYAESAEPGVRHLAGDVEALLRRGDERLDLVAPAGIDPLLGWHLRDARSIRPVAAPARQPQARAHFVVSRADGSVQGAPHLAVYPIRRRAGSLEWVSLQRIGGGE